MPITADNLTYTAAQVAGGAIFRQANPSQTDKLPTAASIVAFMTNTAIGSSFDCILANIGNSFNLEAELGSGITMFPQIFTMQVTEVRTLRFIVTNVLTPAVTVLPYTTTTPPAGGSNESIQFNNNGVLDGLTGWKSTNPNQLEANDNAFLLLGNSGELSITHDDAGSNINSTSPTEDLNIGLGSTDVNTHFTIKDSIHTNLFQIDGTGVTTFWNTNAAVSYNDASVVVKGGMGIKGSIIVDGNSTAMEHISTSDERKKKDIISLGDDVAKSVRSMRVVEYAWKSGLDTTRRKVGVIAQEVMKIAPEAVYKAEDGALSVDYNHIMCMLLKSHQESLTTIQELTKRITILESK